MDNVPYEMFHVALFDRKPVKYFERPECEVLGAKSTTQPYTKFKIWWTKKGHAKLNEHYPNLPAFEESNWHGGFVNGRPMINPAVPVFTCAGSQRPEILYRVVHDQQPHYGMKARGYGHVEITPLLFQAQVDRHLNWRCRDPSPFISTTNCHKKIRRIIRTLRRHGKTGLRIIKFRSSGPGWDHKAQRLFYVPLLGQYFHSPVYRRTPYLQDDYGNREAGKEDGWVLRPTRIHYIL